MIGRILWITVLVLLILAIASRFVPKSFFSLNLRFAEISANQKGLKWRNGPI